MNAGVLAAGFVLDMCFGEALGALHPVRGIGCLVSGYERLLFKKNSRADGLKGIVLVVIVIAVTAVLAAAGIGISRGIHPWCGFACESIMAWSVLAAKDLKMESMRVHHALSQKDMAGAKKALSMIVGRDTHSLDGRGVVKAAVETVAENATDGEIAPLFYLALFGPVAAMVYKAINTMDSMVGYHNERYEHFGRAAARLDDAAGFLPARIAGIAVVAAAYFFDFAYEVKRRILPRRGGENFISGKRALEIFIRDRNRTESPNAGQTESAFAGALGIALGGRAVYFGKSVDKPVLGDDARMPEPEDIVRANRLMYLCSFICFALFLGVRVISLSLL